MARSFPTHLAEPFAGLESDLMALVERWGMFSYLFVGDGTSERIEVMRSTSEDFFLHVQEILVYDIASGIARMNDRTETCGQKNLVLATLVELLDETNEATLISTLEPKVTAAKAAAKSFIDFRHKLTSHRDYAVAVLGAPSPGFPVGQVYPALDAIAKVLQPFKVHFTGAYTMYLTALADGGAESVLSVLRLGHAYRKLRYEGRVPPLPS